MDSSLNHILKSILPQDLIECLNHAGIINIQTLMALSVGELDDSTSETINIDEVCWYIRDTLPYMYSVNEVKKFLPWSMRSKLEDSEVMTAVQHYTFSPGYKHLLRTAQGQLRSLGQCNPTSVPVSAESDDQPPLKRQRLEFGANDERVESLQNECSPSVHREKKVRKKPPRSGSEIIESKKSEYTDERVSALNDGKLANEPDLVIAADPMAENMRQRHKSPCDNGFTDSLSQHQKEVRYDGETSTPAFNHQVTNGAAVFTEKESNTVDNTTKQAHSETLPSRKRKRRRQRRKRQVDGKTSAVTENVPPTECPVRKLAVENSAATMEVTTCNSSQKSGSTTGLGVNGRGRQGGGGHIIFDSDGEVAEERVPDVHPKAMYAAQNKRQCKQKPNFSVRSDDSGWQDESKASKTFMFPEMKKSDQLNSRQTNRSFLFKNDKESSAEYSAIPAHSLKTQKLRIHKVDIDSSSTSSSSSSSFDEAPPQSSTPLEREKACATNDQVVSITADERSRLELEIRSKLVSSCGVSEASSPQLKMSINKSPCNESKCYSSYENIKTPPAPGSIICFKILELNPTTFTPEMSTYKEGVFESYDSHKGRCHIEVITNRRRCDGDGKFDVRIEGDDGILTNYEEEEKTLITSWSALNEVKLIKGLD